MLNLTRRSVLTMLASAGAAPRAFAQGAQPKIAFILALPPDKSAWSYEHARGIEIARQTYGDKVAIDVLTRMPEGGASDLAYVQGLVADGYDMIVSTSFAYTQPVMQTSFAAPNVKFEQCGGQIKTPNLAVYSARWYEGRVIEGMLAGSVTKTNRIGFIASHPMGQVLSSINAAFLAARRVNPDVHMDVLWLNSWFNPQKELQASQFLAAKGVDVFLQDTFSPMPTVVAQKLGYYALGKSTNMSPYGPEAHLMSTIDNWGPYYVERIGALLDASWSSGETWGGLQQKMIEVSAINENLPNRIVVEAQEVLEKLTTGAEHAFTGPIKRQDGSTWLAAGETPTDSDLLSMNFFVEGIQSILPTQP